MTDIFTPKEIEEAASILFEGGIVAFPTETVYGLGANALDPDAVESIFEAKGRPNDNPLIVHIAETAQLNDICEELPPLALKAINAFWPGPFTIVVRKKEIVPDSVTCGLPTVAVRMPLNRIASELIHRSGVPIAAPSANTSGKPSPTNAQHVLEDLDGKIDAIIDGGTCAIGLESTVVDFTEDVPVLLRPGSITLEQLQKVVGEVYLHEPSDLETGIRSPGMKYVHYSPACKVVLLVGSNDAVEAKIDELATDKTGIIRAQDHTQFAQKLFATFRECDAMECDQILVEAVQEEHLGRAIMNRLRKAADEIIELE